MRRKCKYLLAIAIALTIFPISSCQSQDTEAGYQRLTEEKRWYANPSWSPDGSQIIYRPEADGPHELLDLDTNTTQTVLIPAAGLDRVVAIDWITETEIAYVGSTSDGSQSKFAIYDLAEEQTQVLFTSKDKFFGMCWLPADGVFVLLSESGRMPFEVYFGDVVYSYDPDSGELDTVFLTGRELQYVDGIACSKQEDIVVVVEEERDEPGPGQTTSRIHAITTRYWSQNLLHESTLSIEIDSPSWSPDGNWVAVRTVSGSTRNQRRGIMLVSSDGTTVYELEDTPWPKGALVDVRWSPVSNTLLLRHIEGLAPGNRYSLYLYDISPLPLSLQESDVTHEPK